MGRQIVLVTSSGGWAKKKPLSRTAGLFKRNLILNVFSKDGRSPGFWFFRIYLS
jgi:hypothetical protein